MTIAACYVTPEGVVLGADSTASLALSPGGFHYFNYNQKVFEIGDDGASTLGVVTWGLGGLGELSYRTLFALLADDLRKKPPNDVAEVASRWIDQFWAVYSPALQMCQDLNAKLPFDPNANPPDPAARTKHYQRTGSYRTKDLERLLGDPRKRVSGEEPTDFALSCRAADK